MKSKKLIQLIVARHFSNKTVGLLGVPLCKGQPRGGVENGPNTLRAAGMLDSLKVYNSNITDLGNIEIVDFKEPKGKIRNPLGVGRNMETLSQRVAAEMGKYETVINIGGDHSMAIGTIAGHVKSLGKAPAIIWVDAHADINTPQSTWSGNLHGQPVSFLMQEVAESSIQLAGFEWLEPMIRSRDIAYIALRDVDPAEKEFLEKFGICAFSMKDVEKHGVHNILKKCLKVVDPNNDRQFHLSFDIDAMDPTLAPATGTPVQNGLLQKEGEYICEELAKTNRLRCIDLVEVNPTLSDLNGVNKTAETAIQLLQHCVGKFSNHHQTLITP
jgi:arginase